MPLDIPAIQKTLAMETVDGWLLYDFHGSNPIATALAGLSGQHTTRRWYYFIPATGAPKKLVHAIEPFVLDGLPGDKTAYAGRRQLEQGVSDLLRGSKIVAMEYSPECAIPYLSRVDAGTIDFVRRHGVRVVSSGDLVGRFEASWDEAAIATHRTASEKLYRIKDRTFEFVGAKLSAGEALTEYAVQQQMVAWFAEERLVADAAPIAAAQENAGNPHYAPTREKSRAVRANELLLLDLWGKEDRPGAVYADITWTGFAGDAPEPIAKAFAAIAAGRDAAVTKVQTAVAAGVPVHGWEVDRVTREVITAAGYGQYFIHRTGHSLGEEVHGNGVHMDDYETHDDRQLVRGTGFTIEPGIYTPTFGVRTEINMVVGEKSAEVTGPRQQALVRIATRR
ncbi:MAG TPA: M24 family metallopeptidase [Vicinamibacterales bacterium]|nr:M24 family metallopeptidase [Vicinamibacterales bacterium]